MKRGTMAQTAGRFYTPMTTQERADYKANVLARYEAKVGRKYMDRVNAMNRKQLINECFKVDGDKGDYVSYIYWTG